MTTTIRFNTLILMLSLCVSMASAYAQSAPYTNWIHDLGLAQKKQDAAAVAKLTEKAPELAQVWFYGYVYDLVNVNVPPNEQASIRFVASTIAQTLAAKGPAYREPQRLMERLGSERIQTEVEALRLQEEKWEHAPDNGGLLPPQLLVINKPRQAEQLFYRSLFKAEKWKNKLGGPDQAAKFLTIARRLAMGFALALEDFSQWRTLAHYSGGPGVSLSRIAFVEETIGQALNVALKGSNADALSAMKKAHRSVSKMRRDSLVSGLMMNGLASATQGAGDTMRSMTLRERLFAGIRPLNMPALNEVIQAQLLTTYIKADKRERARRVLDELLNNQRKDDVRHRTIQALLEAASFFEGATAKEVAAGRVTRAIDYANLAIKLNVLLAQDQYLTAYELTAEVETKRTFHTEAEARLATRVGEMHLGRAEYEKADAAFAISQTLYETKLGNPTLARSVQLTRLQTQLEQGHFDQVRAGVRKLRALPDLVPEQKASTHTLDATVSFILGEYAPAFAHANKGLTIVHDAKVDAPNVIGALHAVAALTLEAAGFTDAAIERWDWATKFGVGFESARAQARLLMARGETEKALEKLEPYFETEFARETTILHGCLLAGTSRADEAKPSLAVMTPQLSLPQYRRYQAAGFACLAQIEQGEGNHTEALRLADLALRGLGSFPSRAMEWRVLVIKARSLRAVKRLTAASDAYEAALSALEARQYGAAFRGSNFFDFNAGPLVSVERLQHEAAMTAASAAGSRTSRRAELLQRAVTRVRLDRAHRAGFDPYTYQAVFGDVESSRTLRVARAKKVFLSSKVENPLLSERRRAGLLRDIKGLSLEIDRLTVARVLAAKSLEKPYSSRLEPRPTNRVSAYYLVGDAGGFIILDRGKKGGGLVRYSLPNATRLSAIDEKIRALVTVEPQAWKATRRRATVDPNHGTWKRLRDHARLLVPFMFDDNRARIEGHAIELFLSAQLLRTPFDALVIDQPSRRQKVTELQGPGFFGTLTAPIYLIGEQGVNPSSEGATRLVYGRAPLQACGEASEKKCVSTTMVDGVNQLVAGTDASRKQTATAATAPVDGQRAIVLGIPLQVSNAVVSDGEETFALTDQASGVHEVVSLIPQWDRDTTKNEKGLLKFWGGLSRKGTQGIALHRGSFGDESAASLGKLSEVLSSGDSAIASVRNWMRARATSSVDPKEGGAAYHHPYYWAHWQILGDAGQWKPVPVAPPEPPKAAPKPETPESAATEATDDSKVEAAPANDASPSEEAPSAKAAAPAAEKTEAKPDQESGDKAAESSETTSEKPKAEKASASQEMVDPFAESEESEDKTDETKEE